jgi:hypothetical protein
MRLALALEGRLGAAMAAEASALERGAAAATVEATASAKQAARTRVRAGLPGKSGRHINAIRSRTYTGPAAAGRPAGIVYSVLGRGKGAGFVDYLAPHIKGGVMEPRAGGDGDTGRYLVMPVKGVSRRVAKDKRALEGLGTDPALRLIPLSGGRYLFVRGARAKKDGSYRAGARVTILAILVRRVTLRPRVDIAGVREQAGAELLRRLAAKVGGANG